jgi:GDPmannose 4,6-dehydratase
MWRIVQHETAEDWVLATGKTYTVKYFIERAFASIGQKVEWSGKAEQEIGTNPANGKIVVRIDPKYYRPTEVELLIGDPTKAKEKLGWVAQTDVDTLCDMMVQADLEYFSRKLKPQV